MSMSAADELLALADEAAKVLSTVREPNLQATMKALAKASEEIGRAWSGSNIGYHATVYWEGLEPHPPHVVFSSEWGLKERLASNRPNKAWKIYDDQAVVDETLRRAGAPDIDQLDATLRPARNSFFQLKERAVSLLTSALGASDDKFIRRKLDQVDRLNAPDVTTVVKHRLPGEVMSRDSLAVSKGIHPAPHQRLAAIPAVASILEGALDQLEQSSREAASHLRRVEGRNRKANLVGTNVFVGHGRSPIWRELRDFIRDRLGLPVDEFNSVPVAGVATTARLNELLDAASFAFLIMTAEDELADGKLSARLNVVHEVGLFQGRLGFTRAIVLLEEGCEEFSNIHGLGQIRFPKGNISARFEDIRAVLERERLIPGSHLGQHLSSL